MAMVANRRPRREVRNTYKLPEGRAIRAALRAWFRDQRNAVLAYLKSRSRGEKRIPFPVASHGGPVNGDHDGSKAGKFAADLTAISSRGLETKDDGFDVTSLPEWDAFELGTLPMSERMAPLIAAIWQAAGEEFLVRLGLDPDVWDVTSPGLAEAIRQAAFAFCAATNATTSNNLADALNELRAALDEGVVERGESLDWITRRVKEIFDQAETWRARRIAASEASRAVHKAQYEAGRDSDVVTGWRWLASSDACALCLTIARRCPVVRMGQPFAVIGDHPDYSRIEFPPAHPSCRCSMTEVLDIDEQPEWGETLIDPVPEEEDYAAADEHAAASKAMPPPRATMPRPLIRKALRS
jgi:hypothetical protein